MSGMSPVSNNVALEVTVNGIYGRLDVPLMSCVSYPDGKLVLSSDFPNPLLLRPVHII